MKLRSHPLMSCNGLPNWPPAWTWIGGAENKYPKGEVGVLLDVRVSTFQQPVRCFLTIEHDHAQYVGCLLFDDRLFCYQISTLLQHQFSSTIEYIGGLEVMQSL
jgi:hypothetical protein